MKGLTLITLGTAFAASAAWAATVDYNPEYAPNGTHLQSGNPDCQIINDGKTVQCSSYELAGVGNKNATVLLSVSYTATVLCTNKGGNVAPGQITDTTLQSSSGSLRPKNGRLDVPVITSTTSQEAIDAALRENALCPNGNWRPSIEEGSIRVSGYTYTLTFQGYSGPYIIITP